MAQAIIHEGDNLPILRAMPAQSVQLVTPSTVQHRRVRTTTASAPTTARVRRDESGGRVGFGGDRYRSEVESSLSYGDAFESYLEVLQPRLIEIWRLLQSDGTLYLHLTLANRTT